MRRSIPSFSLAAGALLTLSLLPMTARAAPDEITVDVRSISASKEGESFDVRLSDLKTKFETAFGSYSSFKQVAMHSVSIDQSEKETIELATGDTLEVTYDGMSDGLVELGVSVGDQLSTTLRASPGSTFYQAGMSYRDGILILAITVTK
ncbi:MAG: hypothetical protein ABEL76_04165 [Bradymonadaceae bacterium]